MNKRDHQLSDYDLESTHQNQLVNKKTNIEDFSLWLSDQVAQGIIFEDNGRYYNEDVSDLQAVDVDKIIDDNQVLVNQTLIKHTIRNLQ